MLILFFLFIKTIIRCGHIYSWDAEISYQNAGFAENFAITFALESGLTENGFIWIKFPDASISISSAKIKQAILNQDQIIPASSIFPIAGYSGEYFIGLGNLRLLSNRWYKLVLTFDKTYLSAQTEGYKGVVEMETVSSKEEYRIIYDSNHMLSAYQLHPPPKSEITAKYSYSPFITENERRGLANTVETYFDIKPQVNVTGGSIIKITLDNNNWIFNQGCEASEVVCLYTETWCKNITYSEATCTITPNSRGELIYISQEDIVAGKEFRIKTYILNPSSFVMPGGFLLESISKRTSLLFERRTFQSIFEVSLVDISPPDIKYFWGLDPDYSSTKCPIGIYKKADASSSNIGQPLVDIFNDIELQFTVQTTPPLQRLRVEVTLPLLATVIIGSITSNLPRYGTDQITSGIENDPPRIFLENIGQLKNVSYTKNTISFKIHLPTEQIDDLAFSISVLAIYLGEKKNYGLIADGPSVNFKIVKNYEYLNNGPTGGLHFLGPQMGRTGYFWAFANLENRAIDASSFQKILGISSTPDVYSGIPSERAVMELIILLTPNLDQMCCKDKDKCMAAIAQNNNDCTLSSKVYFSAIYFGMIINQNLFNLDTRDGLAVKPYSDWWGSCVNSDLCMFDDMYDSKKMNSWNTFQAEAAFLTFTCISSDADQTENSPCGNLPPFDGSKFTSIGIRKSPDASTLFKNGGDSISSFYGVQRSVDIIACFAYQIFDSGGVNDDISQYITASSSLLNIYLISGSLLPEVSINFINYINDASADFNKAPVFLRLKGRITTKDFSLLSLFLDGNIKISSQLQCVGSLGQVTCRAMPSSVVYSGIPSLSQRVDIYGVGTNKSNFDVFIPVKPSNGNGVPLKFKTFCFDLGLFTSDYFDYNPVTVDVYRLKGFLWAGQVLATSITETVTKISDFTTAGSGYTSINCGTPSSLSNGFSTSDISFKPGITYNTGITIYSSLFIPECLGGWKTGEPISAGGTGFVMAHESIDLIGGAAVIWKSTGKVCSKFSLSGSFGFVCGLDPVVSQNKIGSPDSVYIDNFKVPWTWGVLKVTSVYFTWSGGLSGELAAFFPQPPQGADSYQSSCVSSDWGYVYKSTKMQRLLIAFLPSPGIDLISKSDIVIEANVDKPLSGVTFDKCEALLSYESLTTCTFSGMSFLIKRDTAPASTMASRKQLIYIFLSQDQSTFDTANVWLKIKHDGNEVDRCDQLKQSKIYSSPISDTLTLGLSSVSISPIKNLRTPFSFTFSVTGQSSTKRLLWKGSSLIFYLGWLGEYLFISKPNTRCLIYKGLNSLQISPDWQTIDLTASKTIILTTLSDIPLGSYTLVCKGFQAPSMSDNDAMSFKWVYNALEIERMGLENQVKLQTFRDSYSNLDVILNGKYFNSPGIQVGFKFLLKPSKFDYSNDGRIYIEFPIKYSPKGNSAGLIECYLNKSQTFCEFIDERKISIWPLSGFLKKVSYEIFVWGMEQPSLPNIINKISVHLDQDDNFMNGIDEWAEVPDIYSEMKTENIGRIGITDISSSNNFIREVTDLTLSFWLPDEILNLVGFFFVEFPFYFREIIPKATNLNCSAMKLPSGNKNLVQACFWAPNRRLKIVLSLFTVEKGSFALNLTIKNIPTPHYPNPDLPASFLILLTSFDEEKVLYRSAPGYINATAMIFRERGMSVQQLNWYKYNEKVDSYYKFEDDLLVPEGLLSEPIYLGVSLFPSNVTYDMGFSGVSSLSFLMYPQVPKMIIGKQFVKLRIASKPDQTFGRKIVNILKIGDYSGVQTQIPYLPVILRKSPCQIRQSSSNIKIPANGSSLAITFDALTCPPLGEVFIEGEIEFKNDYNLSFSRDFGNLKQKKRISTSENLVIFVIFSKNTSTPAGTKAQISWTLSGQNKNSYYSIPNTTLEFIENSKIPKLANLNELHLAPFKGGVYLEFKCDSVGFIFYAFGLDENKTYNLKPDFVRNNTLFNDKYLTERSSEDPEWKQFGFLISETEKQAVYKNITGLKSRGIYFGIAWCITQEGLGNENGTKVRWLQEDNGGRVAKLNLNFSKKIAVSEEIEISCALTSLLSINPMFVLSESKYFCSFFLSRVLQDSTQKELDPQNVTRFYVLPDLSSSTSETHNNLKKLYQASDFTSQLFAKTASGENSFPVLLNHNLLIQGDNFEFPVVTKAEFQTGMGWISADFKFEEPLKKGFLYIGVAKNSSLTPNSNQMYYGHDGDSNDFVNKETVLLLNSTYFVNFTKNLKNGTAYAIFYAVSNDDVGPDAVFGSISEFRIETLKKFSITLVLTLRLLILILTLHWLL